METSENALVRIGFDWDGNLSDGDKEFIATLYPTKEGNTIQTAWVDAGYFVWASAEKTQLRISPKGTLMEELSDVIDGEQLTNATDMFYAMDVNGRSTSAELRKAPKFNTSNIVDFTSVFFNCRKLKEVPILDTSKGKYFHSMFYYANNLENFKMDGFGQGTFLKFPYCENPDLDITSSVFEVSSLQYLIDKPTNSRTIWTVNLHKSLQSKVSADLIAQAAAKNIKFEFLY